MIDENRPRARRDGVFDRFRVKRPVGPRRWYDNRPRFHRQQGADVILIVRLKQNDFVSRIQQRHTSRMKGSGRPGAHGDVCFRIRPYAVVSVQLDRKGLP